MKKMEKKMRRKKFEMENFVAFARFRSAAADGFLVIFKERDGLVALSPLTGAVFPVVQRGRGLYALLPLPGGKQYAAPLLIDL